VRALRRPTRGASDQRAPLFPDAIGEPLHPSNLLMRAFKPAAEEAGVPWAGFHTLRHTCASRLFAEGRNAVQVQRWLGHSDPGFTLRAYVHLLDDDLGEPLETPKFSGVIAHRTSDGAGYPSTETPHELGNGTRQGVSEVSVDHTPDHATGEAQSPVIPG
jgi:hypothetical protein